MKHRLLSRVAVLLCLVCLAVLLPAFALAEPSASSVTLSGPTGVVDMFESKTVQLTGAVEPAEASQRITWTTSDRNVATVNAKGLVTLKKPGSVVITATAYRTEYSASVELTVVDTSLPIGITLLSPGATSYDLQKSRTLQLNATVEPAAKANQRITWTSSDRGVATVNAKGLVTFRKRGKVTITATAYRTNFSASIDLTVTNSALPDSITLDAGQSVTLQRFETLTVVPTVLPSTANARVNWRSSNAGVASVNRNGVITARRGGTATISCVSAADRTILATLQVTVDHPAAPESLRMTPDTMVLTQGDTLQLTPEIAPSGSCRFVTWRSSSARIATIDQNGLLTTRGGGFVTVTLTSKENARVKDTRKILVVKPGAPLTITLTDSEKLLHPTETCQMNPIVLPASRDQRVAYKSNRGGVASVDESGLITAHRPGVATITCYSQADRNVLATMTVKVEYLPAPSSISVTAPAPSVEKGETLQLTAKPVPADHSPEFTYRSSNNRIAKVDAHGLVTGVKYGQAQITVTSIRDRKVTAVYTVNVTDKLRPEAIQANVAAITLETGVVYTPTLTVVPSTAVQTVRWSSSRSAVASVNQNGEITMRRAGTATIYAKSTYDATAMCAIQITVFDRPKPTALAAALSRPAIQMGETSQVQLTATPADASTLVRYTVSSDAVSVSPDGVVTPNHLGRATITATSVKAPKVTATADVIVYDPLVPVTVTLDKTFAYLKVGESTTVGSSIFPATASQKVTWSSDNPQIAAVTADGKVTGTGVGNVTIRATAEGHSDVFAVCSFAVSSDKVTLAIPARTTPISGISANLARIEDIRTSAISQIISLARAGVISSTESTARQNVINEAFKMQAFPWMTEKYQPYWTDAYLEKSYQPGLVYYGLPYCQKGRNGENTENRRYNVDKALAENRFTNSGKGYYLLNQSRPLGHSYVGCDCSSFVSMAYWGLKHSASFYRTPQLAITPYFKTLKSYEEMRTGDILVLSNRHVIMFLYWANSAKTQMMIIEQGGDGNTVICSVKTVAEYQQENYIPRRLATYAQN